MRRSTSVVVLAAATLALLAGCAQQRQAARRDATVAALASYPGNPQRSERSPVAAVDYRKHKRVEVLNLGDAPLQAPMVWVNRTYVAKIPTIPARGTAAVNYQDLIQQGEGVRDLAVTKDTVTTVEVQTAEGLYSVLGPARK
jgi:hypothetical protein